MLLTDVALLVDDEMISAKRLMTRDVGERANSTLEPAWVDLWGDGSDRMYE